MTSRIQQQKHTQCLNLTAESSNNHLYDRILCDVPCSSDGTLRKQPLLFSTFTPKTGRMLFPLQRAILYHGLSLLKVGGTLVYSTCSLNPIEDEAVVSSILGLHPDTFEIVDIYNEENLKDPYYGPIIQHLKHDQGVNHWNVYNNKMQLIHSPDEIKENERVYFPKEMFHPGVERLNEIHIERCMRFYPHRQNTGGFFVCVIRKLKDFNADHSIIECTLPKEKNTEEQPQPIVEESDEKTHPNEERLYLWDQKEKQTLMDFYGLDSSFDWKALCSRSQLGRMLVYIHPTIRQLVLDQQQEDSIKPCSIPECELVHTGLRLFQFNTTVGRCPYRLCQESSSFIKPFMTKRKISIHAPDMITLLQSYPQNCSMEDLPSYLQEQIKDLEMGSCLFELSTESISELSTHHPSFQQYYHEFACVFWKGNNNINLLVTQVDIDAMLRVFLM